MPPHLSHLLQPLNVGCFSPLKLAYSRKVKALIRNHINHITKLEFQELCKENNIYTLYMPPYSSYLL